MRSSCIRWIKWCHQTLFFLGSFYISGKMAANNLKGKERCLCPQLWQKQHGEKLLHFESHVSIWTRIWALGGRALSLAKPKLYVHSQDPCTERRGSPSRPSELDFSKILGRQKMANISSNLLHKYKFLRVTSSLKKMKVCDYILKDCILLNGLSVC